MNNGSTLKVKIKGPVLLLQGERDATPEIVADRLAFFQALSSKDKWFVFLRGLGKHAPIERIHAHFDQVLIAFLDQ